MQPAHTRRAQHYLSFLFLPVCHVSQTDSVMADNRYIGVLLQVCSVILAF